ncbi:MAG: hypothetical protein ACK4OO_05935 [bacterium]
MSLLLILTVLFGVCLLALLLTPLEFSGQSHPYWRVSFGYPWLKLLYQEVDPGRLTVKALGVVSLPLPRQLFSGGRSFNRTLKSKRERGTEIVKREGKGRKRKRKIGIPTLITLTLRPLLRLMIKTLSAIQVKRLRLRGSIATEDPALTGWIYAGIVPIYGIVPQLRDHFDVMPHFFAPRCLWEGEWRITVLPIVLLVIFIKEGGIFLWRKWVRSSGRR